MNPLAAFGTWTMSFAVTNQWMIALHTSHRKEHDYGLMVVAEFVIVLWGLLKFDKED